VIFDKLARKSGAVFDPTMRAFIDGGWSRSSAGVHVTPLRALQHAAVFSCVRVLSESVGQLPLYLYKLGADRKSKDKAYDHDLYDVLHTTPNGYMTAQEFAELAVVHLALRGNFYGWKNVVRGETSRELLPLQPRRRSSPRLTVGRRLASSTTSRTRTARSEVLDSSESLSRQAVLDSTA
jgi:HK97 family phage portal protein